MPIAGASRGAASSSFGVLSTPLSTANPKTCVLKWTKRLGSWIFFFFSLLNVILSCDFAAARNRKWLKPDRWDLCKQDCKSHRTHLRWHIRADKQGKKLPQIHNQPPFDCFSIRRWCQASVQHRGFVPTLSSWVVKLCKMKQLSITIRDGGSALERTHPRLQISLWHPFGSSFGCILIEAETGKVCRIACKYCIARTSSEYISLSQMCPRWWGPRAKQQEKLNAIN